MIQPTSITISVTLTTPSALRSLSQLSEVAFKIPSTFSTLLKISQDGFYELMAGNSEIMQQIIKLLSGRIRDTNAKIQELQSKK